MSLGSLASVSDLNVKIPGNVKGADHFKVNGVGLVILIPPHTNKLSKDDIAVGVLEGNGRTNVVSIKGSGAHGGVIHCCYFTFFVFLSGMLYLS